MSQVDSTTLIIITSIVQTVVITLTLAVFIFQFRSQEKAIRESSLQNVMSRYTDIVKMLVDKPELSKLVKEKD
jgi:F0F1-type ATP synthase membrane subunit a